MVEVTADPTSTNFRHPAQPPPSSLSWCDEHRRSAASADPCRPVDPVEPRRRGRGRGSPATGTHVVSRLPVAIRADGNPRARGDPRPTGPGRPGLPVRRPVRVPRDQRLLSGDRRRSAAQPGDLRRPHARRRHSLVGSRPGAAGSATGASDRLVSHTPTAPTEPHRARRRNARALLRRAVAGDVAARNRSGGARGRILPSRPGRRVGGHAAAVLRAPVPGVDPSGREEALLPDVEASPRLPSGHSTGGTDAANRGGEAALGAAVYAGVRETPAALAAGPTAAAPAATAASATPVAPVAPAAQKHRRQARAQVSHRCRGHATAIAALAAASASAATHASAASGAPARTRPRTRTRTR